MSTGGSDGRAIEDSQQEEVAPTNKWNRSYVVVIVGSVIFYSKLFLVSVVCFGRDGLLMLHHPDFGSDSGEHHGKSPDVRLILDVCRDRRGYLR